ncbi:MAG: hypothetical protein LC808_23255, partial [Actinobacteria bacterium]|nr:hypothetical protein [Actinomycetota bacterium]
MSLVAVDISGLPGERTIEHRNVEVIDVYRGIADGFSNAEGSEGSSSRAMPGERTGRVLEFGELPVFIG